MSFVHFYSREHLGIIYLAKLYLLEGSGSGVPLHGGVTWNLAYSPFNIIYLTLLEGSGVPLHGGSLKISLTVPLT